jgi:hypothetical protein
VALQSDNKAANPISRIKCLQDTYLSLETSGGSLHFKLKSVCQPVKKKLLSRRDYFQLRIAA